MQGGCHPCSTPFFFRPGIATPSSSFAVHFLPGMKTHESNAKLPCRFFKCLQSHVLRGFAYVSYIRDHWNPSVGKSLLKGISCNRGAESGDTGVAIFANHVQSPSMDKKSAKDIRIEELHERKSEICREILEDLPEWFAIPQSIDAYAKGVADLPMLVAKDQNGTIIGFIALKQQTPQAVEAYVLGIRREWHRCGCGHLLFEAAEKLARKMGAKFLSVKTLADTHPDPHYKATRLFYEAIGFEPIEVFPTLWSQKNPCLLMIKRLT